jgi:PadR family transcriptional regulator PadR
MVVLGIVAADPEPTYGYRIAHRLKQSGMGQIKGGTLYPVLARLEAEGLIASSWGEGDGGPGRKFITITPFGRDELKRRAEEWRAFIRIALDVLPDELDS